MAKPVCTRREPDMYAWPGDGPSQGRAQAESMPADPAAYSPHHAERVGEADRYSRCYYAAEVAHMPRMTPVLAASLESRGAAEGDVLSIDALNRTFKDGRKKLTAVSDVSLDLRRGETFGLVGESGSGKTTLAKCVTGLIPADSGAVLFEGKQLRPTAGRRSQDALRAIQMVFQNPDSTLNPAWSTRSILTRAVRKLGGAKAGSVRAKVDKLSADVRVEPRFLLQRPTDLSGGQKQRIAIARAFAGDPTLVVCDEPASALDVSVQASILNLLVELQTQRAGVVHLHLARPGRGALHLRPHRGDVPRRAHRGRLRRRGLQPAAPSLHRGAAVVDPQARVRGRAAAHPVARQHAQPERATDRLPVPHPLPPVPRRHLRRTRSRRQQEASDGHTYKCHIPPDELLVAQTAGEPGGRD